MKKPLFSKLYSYIKLIRISNWPKNFFVFVPAVFSRHFFHIGYFQTILIGFATFSIASSAVYVLNDIVDLPKDAIHPLKKDRPLASGAISKNNAIILAVVLYVLLFLISFEINHTFIAIVWIYVFINLLYTFFLKEVVIVDIFCIASGFMLRVLGGAYLISVYISNWLVLTAMFLSLFLAVMKRRVEISNNPNATEQRIVLKEYSLNFIDQIAAMTGSGVILSYALYSVADRTVKIFGTEKLVFTSLFVIFGIFRYMYLVYKKDRGENVIQVLMTDIPMIINFLFYILTTFYIIYFRNV